MGQRLRVKYDAARLSTAQIAEAVAPTGMRAWLEHEEPVAASIGTRPAARGRWSPLSGGAPSARGSRADALGWPPRAGVRRSTASPSSPAASTRRGGRSRPHAPLSLDINVLMLVAVVGAIALGEWSEAAVGHLPVRARAGARDAQHGARAPRDPRADGSGAGRGARAPGDGERRLAVDEVAIGDTIVVRPGEKIPLDGRVAAGESQVNQAPITGESLPVDKAAGDEVFAGTINGHGALEVRVTRLRRDTTLARIIHSRRAGAGAARADPGVRRALRALLHAGRARASRRRSPSCRRWRSGSRSGPGSTARSCCSSSRARARW